jgi:hypothetical protein
MTNRRGLIFLVVLAAVGLALAGVTAPAATRTPPPARRTTPSINLPFQGSTCYLAGQSCSIHPCVQLIAGSAAPKVRIPRLATPACIRRPTPTGRPLYVGH